MGKFRCFLFNFGWFLDGEFDTMEKAVEYGKSKGFEFTVYEVAADGSPTNPSVSWSPIGGLRRYAA